MPLRSVFSLAYNTFVLNSTNRSEDDEENDEILLGFYPEVDVIPIIEAVLIISINFWVLYAVYKKRSLRTVANYILASLALSDLLTGLVGIPSYLTCSAIQKLAICATSAMFLRFTSVSTVTHLFCVTMDRYVSIMFSLRYCTLVTKKRGFIIVALMWCLSMFVSLIQLIWFSTDDKVHDEPSVEVKNHELRFDLFSLTVFFAIPLLVMVLVYARIFAEVRRQNCIIQKHSTPGWQNEHKNHLKERRAIITFAMMVFCYVIGWLPYFTLRIQHHLDIIPNLPESVIYLFIYLRYATSLANPLLYILGKQDFRKALPRINRDRNGTSISMSRTENFRLSETQRSLKI